MDEVGGLIARAANRHRGKSDREAAGVLSAAQSNTHFLESPDRGPRPLGFPLCRSQRRHVSVFLVLPRDRLPTYSRWLRLIVTQSLLDMARDPESRKRPSSTCWMSSHPPAHLAPVERTTGVMAGYGVQLWPILQDVHQLRATYGQKAGRNLLVYRRRAASLWRQRSRQRPPRLRSAWPGDRRLPDHGPRA
ncbi:type IV secretory system conjugative DNA transfer family protein [Sinorhizobium meliloti]|uniref:type IV secretory system conjugative DNA transfer family protein n=1 Tax=Rhizobium meliloti TaxID=382 RepID=UPI0023527FAB|nr:type IV secretory system conjugative DNA transfer family protein [Sinorhizobium meliloti]